MRVAPRALAGCLGAALRTAVSALRGTWELDTEPSATSLAAEARRTRRARIGQLRHAFQAAAAALVLWIGWHFAGWVHALQSGERAGSRPPGVEGFLPIAALMSLRHLWTTGEVHPVHPAGLVILLAVLATSLVLKKAFCSWICPVGTLAELLGAVGRRTLGRGFALPRVVDVPLRGLKYALLAFFVHAIFVAMTPAAVEAFLDSPYNRVADVKMLLFFERLSPLGLQVLGGLVLLSVLVPMAWCRYLCPYGALLGLVSLLSPLKVTRHAPSCIDCGLCTKACPSRLPVARLRRVRSDECVGCLGCIAACPVPRALRVESMGPFRLAVRPALFAVFVLLLFGGPILAGRALGIWRSAIGDAEYAARVREIDAPQYHHAQGRLPEETEPGVR